MAAATPGSRSPITIDDGGGHAVVEVEQQGGGDEQAPAAYSITPCTNSGIGPSRITDPRLPVGAAANPRQRSSQTAAPGAVGPGAIRTRPYIQPSRVRRAPARPLRVLPARRRVQDRQARRARGSVRAAGAGAHRPRGHERRRGASEGLPQARHQADPGLRGLLRRRPPQRRRQVRAQPPDAAGAVRRRVPQPRQAHQRRLPRGLSPRQGQRGPGAARSPLGGRDRPHRLPAVALLPAPGGRQPGGGARARRRADRRLRRRERVLRAPAQRAGGPGQGQRGDRAHRPRGRPAAGGHGRRALPGPRGLPEPRGAAVRPDQVDARGAQAHLRHQRVLSQGLRGDGGVVRALARGGAHLAGDRRALRGRHRAGQAADPALPDA